MVVLGQILSYPSLVLLTLRPFWDKFGVGGVASDFARRRPLKERESHGWEVSVWSLQQVSNREFLHNWRENFHCFGIDISYDEFCGLWTRLKSSWEKYDWGTYVRFVLLLTFESECTPWSDPMMSNSIVYHSFVWILARVFMLPIFVPLSDFK